MRSLFLTPEASRRFITALDNGGSLAEGNPQPQANGRRQAGFYVAGDDFVHWNQNGQGQAFIDGQWRRIDPDSVTRLRNADGTTTLTIDQNGRQETLLRVDPRMPALRADAGTMLEQIDHTGQESERRAERMPGPTFESPYLNRLLGAVVAGDAMGADRILREYARSPEGVAFLERGTQATVQQQAEEREVHQPPLRQV